MNRSRKFTPTVLGSPNEPSESICLKVATFPLRHAWFQAFFSSWKGRVFSFKKRAPYLELQALGGSRILFVSCLNLKQLPGYHPNYPVTHLQTRWQLWHLEAVKWGGSPRGSCLPCLNGSPPESCKRLPCVQHIFPTKRSALTIRCSIKGWLSDIVSSVVMQSKSFREIEM